MAEYIEREAVEEMLENAQLVSDGEYCGYCTDDIRIGSIPAADVAPVVHGKWYHTGEVEWSCTNCGNVIATKDSWECPTKQYCDECGARMDGGKENAAD